MTATTTGVPEPAGPPREVTAGAGPVGSHDPSDATGPVRTRPHFRAFEGLRALAAVMVVVHHSAATAGPQRAGLLATPAAVMDSGVAVFFVISGFLIYRPFVATHLAGDPSMPLRSFWWRRALRIVPAYWAALTFFWALGSFQLGHDWWRYYLFLQIYSRSTALGGVIQAWSLCTEMTFYLLIPFWVAGLRRLAPGRRALAAQVAGCGVLYAAGYASRAIISAHFPSERGLSFDWLPTNIDLFAVGMAVAVLSTWAARRPDVQEWCDRVATFAGLWWAAAVALFAWYAYRVGPANFATGYTGWFWQQRQLVLGVITCLILVPAVFGPQDRGVVRRVLTCRPVVWVGSVSYGIYLWHFDWLKRVPSRTDGFGRQLWPGWVHSPQFDTNVWPLLAVGLAAGCIFAALSWELLERPLQRWKTRF